MRFFIISICLYSSVSYSTTIDILVESKESPSLGANAQRDKHDINAGFQPHLYNEFNPKGKAHRDLLEESAIHLLKNNMEQSKKTCLKENEFVRVQGIIEYSPKEWENIYLEQKIISFTPSALDKRVVNIYIAPYASKELQQIHYGQDLKEAFQTCKYQEIFLYTTSQIVGFYETHMLVVLQSD